MQQLETFFTHDSICYHATIRQVFLTCHEVDLLQNDHLNGSAV